MAPGYRHPTVANVAAGFTLVELMITISIAVILLVAGVPGFSTLIKNQVLSAEASNFSMTLALARSQARSQKTQISICKSVNETSCTTVDTEKWNEGWIMFIDKDADGILDNADTLLRTYPGVDASVSIGAPDAFKDYIAFVADGRALGSGSTAPPADGQFRFCDQRGAAHARVVDVSPIGRARVDPEPGAASCP